MEAMQAHDGPGADFTVEAMRLDHRLRQAVDCTGPGRVVRGGGRAPLRRGGRARRELLISMGRTVRGIVEGEAIPALFIPHAGRPVARGPASPWSGW